MACELKKAKIPYAINADTQFYDGEEGAWRPAHEPLLRAMIAPDCETPGQTVVKSLAPGVKNAPPAVASTAKSTAP